MTSAPQYEILVLTFVAQVKGNSIIVRAPSRKFLMETHKEVKACRLDFVFQIHHQRLFSPRIISLSKYLLGT